MTMSMTATILIAGWSGLALAVIAGCLIPANRLPCRLPNDKVMHLVSYAGLSLPLAVVAPSSGLVLAGAIILLGAGLAIEFAQHFVPGRSFCMRDMLANALGVLVGTVCGLTFVL
ncbi:VanZ family protein [Skermanella aerolata]|uniref:VanZ family protein n=1 Tax=Skermanella aerolata TaxID=393310 RepID=UPI003D2617BD